MNKNIKFKGLSQEETDNLLIPNLIFLGYRGSIAHGMYVPNTDPNSIDDKDVMGVFLAAPNHYIGMNTQKETIEKWYNEWDCVYYELRKLISLLQKGNPNVLSLLWLDDKYVLYSSPGWERIKSIREAFVCKNVYHSFSGYAHGQFKRMTASKFEGYMGKKRKALTEKHGYDCKNAAHLIRLLKMGIEFLTEGQLYVTRGSDATQLLDIKNGNWSFDEVKTEADKLFKLCEEAYIRSTLPNRPNYKLINDICSDIIFGYLRDSLD